MAPYNFGGWHINEARWKLLYQWVIEPKARDKEMQRVKKISCLKSHAIAFRKPRPAEYTT